MRAASALTMLLEASPRGTYDCMCDTIEKRRPTISSSESAEPPPLLLPTAAAEAATPSVGEENLLPLLLLGALAPLLSPHPRTCNSAKGEGEAAATAWLWLLL